METVEFEKKVEAIHAEIEEIKKILEAFRTQTGTIDFLKYKISQLEQEIFLLKSK